MSEIRLILFYLKTAIESHLKKDCGSIVLGYLSLGIKYPHIVERLHDWYRGYDLLQLLALNLPYDDWDDIYKDENAIITDFYAIKKDGTIVRNLKQLITDQINMNRTIVFHVQKPIEPIVKYDPLLQFRRNHLKYDKKARKKKITSDKFRKEIYWTDDLKWLNKVGYPYLEHTSCYGIKYYYCV